MNNQTKPMCWTKICAQALIPALIGTMAMAWLVVITSAIPGPTGYAISILANLVAAFGILVFLESGLGEMWAYITGDTVKQKKYQMTWLATKQSYIKAFRTFRSADKRKRPDCLREMGAVGVDLVAKAHRQQSAGRQSGRKAGGHKKPASSSDDGDGDGGSEPPASLPLILTVHDLARLLQVSAKTLQNKPKSALPPAVFIPACRGPRYHRNDVVAWLRSCPVGYTKPPVKPNGKTGRPRLATPSQIAAVRGKGGVQ